MDATEIISQILDTALKVSVDTEKLEKIFKDSGISIEGDAVSNIEGNPADALQNLMANLSPMAVVKISAKQIIRKAGISI